MSRSLITVLLTSLLASGSGWGEDGPVTARRAEHSITLTGFTRARTALTLSAEVAGKVERVFSDLGEAVPEEGDFVCLDKTFIDLDIRSNRAEQARLEVEIDYYRKQVTRYQALVRQKSSAQAQLDEAKRGLDTTRQQLRAAQIEGETLAERKERYCITAPPGRLVMERRVEPGQWVSAGESVGRVGDYSRLLIPFALTLPEYQALQHSEEPLQVTLPELGLRLPARIERISPAFDEASHKIRLDLEITGDLNMRRGGLRAELTLSLPDQSGAVQIPEAALAERYEEYWLRRPDGSEIRVVYLGRSEPENGEPTVRVVSPEVGPGDQFLLNR